MITVVGIGGDGWAGLGAASREAIATAEVLMGSPRQLALVPAEIAVRRELLPSPLAPALPELTSRNSLCLLASGDPMLHGIGATLARLLPAAELRVLPAVSSVSLAAARLGWPLADVTVRSLLTIDPVSIVPDLAPGRRLLLLLRAGMTPYLIQATLQSHGWGASRIHVCSDLGLPEESVEIYDPARRRRSDLVIVAVECILAPGSRFLGRLAGLPDDAYERDGALTRREVRALVLAHLAPAPGELLWDIGAGSGSVGIEWLRAEPTSQAIALEMKHDRMNRILANSITLGVPQLRRVEGAAPHLLPELPQPQAVFIGGGLTTPGVIEACWDALPDGGRLVATAVTIESEALLHTWAARVGGELTRLELSHAKPLGSFTTWRPELPIVVWAAVKP